MSTLLKNYRWGETKECQKSLDDSKIRLLIADLLVHFNVKKNFMLTCDASK